MPYISPSEIPNEARFFGLDLMAYCLALPKEAIEKLLESGGSITNDQLHCIKKLAKIAISIKGQRATRHFFTSEDAFTISCLQAGSEPNPFSQLREINEPSQPPNIEDQIEFELKLVCDDCYPYILIENYRSNTNFQLPFPQIQLGPSAVKLAEILIKHKCFYDITTLNKNILLSRINISACSSGPSSIQMYGLIYGILASGYCHCLIENDLSLERFYKNTLHSMNNLINGIKIGRMNITSGVFILGASMEDNDIEIDTKRCKIIKNSKPLFEKITDQNDSRPYVIALRERETKVYKKSYEEDGYFPSEWHSKTQTRPLELAIALASGNENTVKSFHRVITFEITPLSPSGVVASKYNSFASCHTNIKIDKEIARQITHFLDNFKDNELDKIGLAIDRLIIAINERRYPDDALVDAIIGLESLFGQKSDISLSIALATAKLLGKSPDESLDIFRKVKRLYDIRSTTVHGNKMRNYDDLFVARDTAISFLGRVIESILFKNANLLSYRADKRLPYLIL